MKFQSKLSYYENMDAWQEHSLAAPHTQTSELNDAEKTCLLALNESLRQLEDKYLPILNAKYKALQARVDNPSDWMNEFNLCYVITFYLREDDPEYEEDDDNILMQLQSIHSAHDERERDWGFGATHIDHAISVKRFADERHCNTYCQLYDHCHLDWRDLLRIGNLYVELKIDEQSGMLDALLPGNINQPDDVLRDLEIGQLKPGKYQQRSRMDESSLNELAASIKKQGVIQPILVSMRTDGSYEIIAGERRWRAAQLAGFTHVPVLVRKVSDGDELAMAMIEYINREDPNQLEEAQCIQRLIVECNMTHQMAADAVSRSSGAVSNLLQLLKLTEPVQEMLMADELDIGQARVLLALDGASQITVAYKILLGGLSVRAAEKLVERELAFIANTRLN